MEQVMRGDGQSKVAFCGCGKLHFTYGPVTLHFERDEFLTFADSVSRLGALVRQADRDSILEPDRIPGTTICH